MSLFRKQQVRIAENDHIKKNNESVTHISQNEDATNQKCKIKTKTHKTEDATERICVRRQSKSLKMINSASTNCDA